MTMAATSPVNYKVAVTVARLVAAVVVVVLAVAVVVAATTVAVASGSDSESGRGGAVARVLAVAWQGR